MPARLADTPIDFESLREVGAIMGSGGLVVLDDSACMVDMARYFLQFTEAQSCGKCTFCGRHQAMLELLDRLCTGKAHRNDLDELKRLAHQVGGRQPLRPRPDRAEPGATRCGISMMNTKRTSAALPVGRCTRS